MANANSTEINLTTEQINAALYKISTLARSVKQLSISAVNANNLDERESLILAIENIAGQIGWISEVCATKFGGGDIARADPGYWILDSNFAFRISNFEFSLACRPCGANRRGEPWPDDKA